MLPRLARFGAFALSLALAVPAPDLRVRPDPNQVCASRLAGAWELDAPLTERLGAKPLMERVEFTPDEGVLAHIPAELTEFIAKERIWQAGTMKFTQKGTELVGPYALVTHTGNSIVVYFRSRTGEALDDSESCILTVVPAKDAAQDLLFVGGVFKNEPFRAYHRVAAH